MSAHSFILYIGALSMLALAVGFAADAVRFAVERLYWRGFLGAWACAGAFLVAVNVWIAAGAA